MSDTAMYVWVVGAALAAVAAPLAAYALMPRKLLNLASEHGRYAGLGTAEQTSGAAENAPAVVVGSLQGHAG
jgi:hypothetical protein